MKENPHDLAANTMAEETDYKQALQLANFPEENFGISSCQYSFSSSMQNRLVLTRIVFILNHKGGATVMLNGHELN